MKKQFNIYKLMLCLLMALTCTYQAIGQNREQGKVELKTRLVMIDVLVKEKRTGAIVNDLARTNFEILADRKPRPVTYFSANEKRRPLALILAFDLAPGGAGRFFRQPDNLKSFGTAFSKLFPDDEVAVIATWIRGIAGNEQYLVDFTTDRRKLQEELMKIPGLVGDHAISAIPYVSPSDLLSEAEQMAKSQRPNSNVLLVYISDRFVLVDPRGRQSGVESAQRGQITFSALLCRTNKAAFARSSPFSLWEWPWEFGLMGLTTSQSRPVARQSTSKSRKIMGKD
jgi:hypothetical protein